MPTSNRCDDDIVQQEPRTRRRTPAQPPRRRSNAARPASWATSRASSRHARHLQEAGNDVFLTGLRLGLLLRLSSPVLALGHCLRLAAGVSALLGFLEERASWASAAASASAISRRLDGGRSRPRGPAPCVAARAADAFARCVFDFFAIWFLRPGNRENRNLSKRQTSSLIPSCSNKQPACKLLKINKLAGQEGLEPPTCGFGDRRSTNWSYWPVTCFFS